MFEIVAGIAKFFGIIILFLYNFLSSNNFLFSFGLAIIILTIIIKIILLPLAIKSFKSMAQMHEMQPLLAEIQRKYKNDKEALNRETMKIYQEKKINPLGGCLPVLIQLPIFIGLFWVMAQPLTYMFNYDNQFNTNLVTKEVIRNIESFNDNSVKEIVDTKKDLRQRVEKVRENYKNSSVNDFKKALKNEFNAAKNSTENNEARKLIDEISMKSNNYYLEISVIKNQSELVSVYKNMDFLGINLTEVPPNILREWPEKKDLVLLIVPLLVAISTYFSSKYSQIPSQGGEKNQQTEMQNAMQKQMLVLMPLMSGWFSFIVPTGLSLYWIISNIIQMIQQKVLINVYIKKNRNIKEA